MADCDSAIVDGAKDEELVPDLNGLFELGVMHSAGSAGAIDLISAHMWFNIAAMLGHKEAAQYRREIAAEMADSDIGTAQRAARAWLKTHRKPAALSAAA